MASARPYWKSNIAATGTGSRWHVSYVLARKLCTSVFRMHCKITL